MGTSLRTINQIDRFMEWNDPEYVGLLFGSGHLTFAGIDPVSVPEKPIRMVGSIHLKDVLLRIRDRLLQEGWCFLQAVKSGVFTVHRDGDEDFSPF